ncbi:MAG: acetolactate synthase small subunit [Phototrophicales bacterium]|nr:MAG: acetolactate synthase small subunit [Phototrophicales bacterium]
MKHTIICLVENKPGVLNRVVSLFRRRNFNMDSLTVGRTHNPDVSRITIVMEGEAGDAKKVVWNLYKLIDVIEVQDVTDVPTVERDLVLAKVNAPDAYSRNNLTELCYQWGARLVDIGPDVAIVEYTGTADKVEDFIDQLRSYGIVELVRSGLVSMGRGIRIMEGMNHKTKRFAVPAALTNGAHESES